MKRELKVFNEIEGIQSSFIKACAKLLIEIIRKNSSGLEFHTINVSIKNSIRNSFVGQIRK